MQHLCILLLLNCFLGLNAVELPAEEPPFTIAMPSAFKPAMDYLRHIVTPGSPEYTEEDFYTALESMRQFMGHPEGCTAKQAQDLTKSWLLAKLINDHSSQIDGLDSIPDDPNKNMGRYIKEYVFDLEGSRERDKTMMLPFNIFCRIQYLNHNSAEQKLFNTQNENYLKCLGVIYLLGSAYRRFLYVKSQAETFQDSSSLSPSTFKTSLRDLYFDLYKQWLDPWMQDFVEHHINFIP